MCARNIYEGLSKQRRSRAIEPCGRSVVAGCFLQPRADQSLNSLFVIFDPADSELLLRVYILYISYISQIQPPTLPCCVCDIVRSLVTRERASAGTQLHEGFKKLNLKPSITFSREDFDEFTCHGCVLRQHCHGLAILFN